MYGAVVSVPTSVAPAKKSTLATVPSLSLGVAVSVIVAGAVKLPPPAGLVSATVGARWAAAQPP